MPMIASPYDRSLGEWEQWFQEHQQPTWRAQQLFQGLYQRLATSYDAIAVLPRALREELAIESPFTLPTVASELRSRDDRTIKVLLTMPDGRRIESVLMLYPPNPESPRPRATVCVSTQAGCAYGCTFCATGQMGFERHLTAGEIVAQVLHFARLLRAEPWGWQAAGSGERGQLDHVTNIVLMGMGEPLHNYDHTLKALRLLNDPAGFQLGARHMTVSTVGLVPAIQRLAQEGLQVNLAISLHAPNNVMRSQTMPVARKWPLEELLATCLEFTRTTGRQVTFEYVLLAGVNAGVEHATELGQRLAPFGPLAHVNLIPVNATSATYRPPDGATIRAFRETLRRLGISNSVRAERGDDIAAACGQLRTRDDRARQRTTADART